jgi:hypothetical protein
MRTITALLIFATALLAQDKRQPQSPATQATPQQATTLTTAISADMATALETMRLNTKGPSVTDAQGVTTQRPIYPTIQALWDALTHGQAGLLAQIIAKYPPASIKAAQDAAAKSTAAANAAAAAAVQ